MQQAQKPKPDFIVGVEALQEEFPVYSLNTYRRKVSARLVPMYKIGNRTFFDRETILQWLTDSRILTATERQAENSEALSKSVTKSARRRK